MKKEPTVKVSFRLRQDLYKRVWERAADNGLSFSAMLQWMVVHCLEHEPWGEKGEPRDEITEADIEKLSWLCLSPDLREGV